VQEAGKKASEERVEHLQEAVKGARKSEEEKLQWKYQSRDQQFTQKEKRLKEELVELKKEADAHVRECNARVKKATKEVEAEKQALNKKRDAVGVERRYWQGREMEFKDMQEQLKERHENAQVRTDVKEAVVVSAQQAVVVAQEEELQAKKGAAQVTKRMESQQNIAKKQQAKANEVIVRQTNVIQAQGGMLHEQNQVLAHAKRDMQEKEKAIKSQAIQHVQDQKLLVREHQNDTRRMEGQIWELDKKLKTELNQKLSELDGGGKGRGKGGERQAKLVALRKLLELEEGEEEEEEESIEDEEEEEEEAQERWTRDVMDIYRYEEGHPRSMTVEEIAMEVMTMEVSSRAAVKIHKLYVSHLPGAKEHLTEKDYPERRYFQRKLKEARVVGMLMNALDLAKATAWHSVKGDGTSDHHILHGQQDKYAFVHEITDMHGEKKTIVLDGFLTSWGLTAEKEVEVSLEVMKQLRKVLTLAKEMFAKMFPKLVAGSKWLGPDVDVENIGTKWYAHFGADGAAAAQLWARLMGENKVNELDSHFTAKQLEEMSPQERHHLYFYVVTNCTLHDLHLGGSHASKAARLLTLELTASAVAALKAAGHVTNSFSLAPLLAQMLHTTHKFCSLSVGYVFGKATGLLLLMQGKKWAMQPYFRFGRMRGNRFVAQYFATVPVLFMHEPLLEFLVTQILRDRKMQTIVRNLWGQLNCRELMIEARAHEALYNFFLEPLMVVLGIDYLPGDEDEEEEEGWSVSDEEEGDDEDTVVLPRSLRERMLLLLKNGRRLLSAAVMMTMGMVESGGGLKVVARAVVGMMVMMKWVRLRRVISVLKICTACLQTGG
jgi:hypothetical protein